jgi:hypothetical protein
MRFYPVSTRINHVENDDGVALAIRVSGTLNLVSLFFYSSSLQVPYARKIVQRDVENAEMPIRAGEVWMCSVATLFIFSPDLQLLASQKLCKLARYEVFSCKRAVTLGGHCEIAAPCVGGQMFCQCWHLIAGTTCHDRTDHHRRVWGWSGST